MIETKQVREVLVCLMMGAGLALAIQGCMTLRAIEVATMTAQAEVETARMDLTNQISRVIDGDPKSSDPSGKIQLRQMLVQLVKSEVDGARRDIKGELTTQLDSTRTAALSAIDAGLKPVSAAVEVVDAFRKDLGPVLDNAKLITGHVNSISAHVDDALPSFTDCAVLDSDGTPIGGNPDCLFNRFQGTTRAVEKAAVAIETAGGDVTGMTGDFRRAVPVLLEDAKKAGDASVLASQNTAKVMGNFATATKPLPTWLRIGLQVAPPAAQAGAAAIAGGLALGWFKGK
jgi:hypothetical protein